MKFFITILFALLTCYSFGQTENDFFSTENAKKSLQFAQELINEGKLKAARKQLKHTIKIKDNFAVAYRELGMVNLELSDYSAAVEAFEMSFDLDEKLSRAAFFECGEAHFRQGNSEMATYYYTKYKELKDTRYANKQKESGLEIGYDAILPEREANCKYLADLGPSTLDIHPVNLGDGVNSSFDDYLPAVTNHADRLIFTRTNRKGNQNIYLSEADQQKWGKAKPFGREINTNKNEGMAKLEAHGKLFYFAGCFRPESQGGCDIYKALFENGKVSGTQLLEGNINSDKWDSQPSVTCDGQLLYFTSSRDGGQGGADIWCSQRNPDGSWGSPYNLGSGINTPKDEEAPYISNDGRTLYFTSTGHLGQGEGDLFISRKTGDHWSMAKNMDYPFNSPAKELGFFIHADGKTAYFSSARGGGEGGLDLYQVEVPEAFRPASTILLEGQVVDNATQEPVFAYIKVSREEEHRYVTTDDQGQFFMCLPGDKGYSFQINEQGYDYFVDARFVASSGDLAPTKVKLELVPKLSGKPKLVAKPSTLLREEKRVEFFFETGSYSLTHEDLLELEKLAEILKRESSWSAEVVGYADKNGSAKYNKWLSEQRAQKIMAYLRKVGVNSNQVVKLEGKGSVNQGGSEKEMRRVDVVLYRG